MVFARRGLDPDDARLVAALEYPPVPDRIRGVDVPACDEGCEEGLAGLEGDGAGEEVVACDAEEGERVGVLGEDRVGVNGWVREVGAVDAEDGGERSRVREGSEGGC